jgi:hypothetical protein
MISEVYDALKDAEGVTDEKARKAAKAVAQFNTRFSDLTAEIREVKSEMKGDISELRVDMESLKGRVQLVQWQLVAVLGGVTTLVLKAFF